MKGDAMTDKTKPKKKSDAQILDGLADLDQAIGDATGGTLDSALRELLQRNGLALPPAKPAEPPEESEKPNELDE
jgi:hypothetical protein